MQQLAIVLVLGAILVITTKICSESRNDFHIRFSLDGFEIESKHKQ